MEKEPVDLENTVEIPVNDIEDTMELGPIKDEEMNEEDGTIL